MTPPSATIAELNAEQIQPHLSDLCRILIDSVQNGAAISFMQTITPTEAEDFWLTKVKSAVTSGDTRLFGAFVGDRLIGTVQLILAMPPNQPHRAEISKMIVHPDGRRQGLGKALMTTALQTAQQCGKTLVTLDTRSGDVSEALYRQVGFQEAGKIPEYAFDPDGKTRHATTYMYRYL